MSAHKGTDFGLAVSGLIGVVLLVFVVYMLTVARFSSGTGASGTPQEVAARVKPVGSVSLAGDSTAPPAAPAASTPAATAADAGPGAAIYTKACVACHATGAANAPKIDDKAAWEPRAAQGVAQLLQTAIDGKGAMPPRGTCADCSDDDLKTAIEYMLAKAGFDAAASTAESGAATETPVAGAGEPTSEVMPGISGVSGTSGSGTAPVGR